MLYLYKKLKPQPRGGTNPKEIYNCSCMWSESGPDLCLTEPDLSLTKCNYQSESWFVRHLNLLTEASTKTQPERPTRVEERGREQFPRLHAIMHSQFSPYHLLQYKNCQIQSILSRWEWLQSNWSKSQWFRILNFLHYLINLSIK